MLFRTFFAAVIGGASALLVAPQANAQQAERMLQCEDCATIQDMQRFAMARAASYNGMTGMVDAHIFSLRHGLIQNVHAIYNLPQMVNQLKPNSAVVEEGFASMLEAYSLDSRTFVAMQVHRGRVDDLPGRGHDPVRVSTEGEHGAPYGAFMQSVRECFNDASCARKIDPILAHKLQADRRLTSVGIGVLGVNGSVGWENADPGTQVWLCNSNNDCALVEFDGRTWAFVETRAEGGRGARYPRYEEELRYNLPNPGQAAGMERGLSNAGFSIYGSWSVRAVFGCSNVGSTKACHWILVPN